MDLSCQMLQKFKASLIVFDLKSAQFGKITLLYDKRNPQQGLLWTPRNCPWNPPRPCPRVRRGIWGTRVLGPLAPEGPAITIQLSITCNTIILITIIFGLSSVIYYFRNSYMWQPKLLFWKEFHRSQCELAYVPLSHGQHWRCSQRIAEPAGRKR